jgi:hypothetical protein
MELVLAAVASYVLAVVAARWLVRRADAEELFERLRWDHVLGELDGIESPTGRRFFAAPGARYSLLDSLIGLERSEDPSAVPPPSARTIPAASRSTHAAARKPLHRLRSEEL